MKIEELLNWSAIIGGVSFLAYAEQQRKNNTPKIYLIKELPNNFHAFTIPPFGIFIKKSEKNNKILIEHELVHWQQFQKEGIISYMFNYIMESLQNGYDQNKYEIEARHMESDFCQKNYTECVRKGNAKTIYNPNFRI